MPFVPFACLVPKWRARCPNPCYHSRFVSGSARHPHITTHNLLHSNIRCQRHFIYTSFLFAPLRADLFLFIPMEDFHPATRTTSHNAHGHKRRIGHSKKSSIDSDDSPPQKKEKKVDIPKQQAESCVPSLSGASTFFHNQRVGAKGIRSKIKEAENAELLHISHQQFSAFLDLAAVADPNNAFIEQLNTNHRKELHRLAWLLLAEHNVLLYGIGNKCPLIKELVESFLNGEDVIEVSMPSHNTITPTEQQMAKSLLEHIEKTVLKNRFLDTCALSWPKRAELIAAMLDVHYGRSGKASTFRAGLPLSPVTEKNATAPEQHQPQPQQRTARVRVVDSERWGGRYALAQSKLYVIIPDICGEFLSDRLSQQCLSILAQCPSVAIVATVENLNSISVWDRTMLARFQWSYHHCATFERYNLALSKFPLVVGRDLLTLTADEMAGLQQEAAKGVNDRVDVREVTSTAASSSRTAAPVAAVTFNTAAAGGKASSGGGSSAPTAAKSTTEGERTGSSRIGASKSVAATGVSASNGLLTFGAVSSSYATKSMQAINNSLTPKHSEMLAALIELLRAKAVRMQAELAAANGTDGSKARVGVARAVRGITQAQLNDPLSHYNGIATNDLFEKLRSTLVVKTPNDLTNLMKEYLDHGVLAKISHQNQELICLRPPYDLFKKV